MTPTPAPISDTDTLSALGPRPRRRPDPVLADAVEAARTAAENEATAGDEPLGPPRPAPDDVRDGAVGAHAGVVAESEDAATHFFESNYSGYVGWRWAVTVARAGADEPVTVSEVVLLPGPDALTAPDWVPWSHRIRPGDLSAGDLLPGEQEDVRLTSGAADDPDLAALAGEVGMGRNRVMSKEGRLRAAERWHAGEFGPDSETAQLAPASCGSCGFFLPLEGSMRAAFGVCGNEIAPADGRVVHVEFGCGAHSEAEVDTSSTVPVAEVIYDDTTLDYESREPGQE